MGPWCSARTSPQSRFCLDGNVGIADVVATLAYLFTPPVEPCQLAIDANDDEQFDIADAVYTLAVLFSGGTAISAPTGTCGPDPTPGDLTCVLPPVCP